MKWMGMATALLCMALLAFTLDARRSAPPSPPSPAASQPSASASAPGEPSDAPSGASAPAPAVDLPSGATASESGRLEAPRGAADEPVAVPEVDATVAPPVEPEAPSDIPAAPAPRAAAASSAEASASGPAAPSLASDDPPRRSRRWRRRNIYPGPIPTPEEWVPPEGPVRVALQVGHWRTEEAPRELDGLRSGGTRWQGMHEWEANMAIAQRTSELLEAEGYEVEILPAVVPPGYRAHLFIAIHADGSADPHATGYRVAAPRRDATGRASQMVSLLERSYGEATGLPLLPTITRRMSSYYAFNFRRYRHALHPMTIAVILETGFLTSARDRRVIVDDPERSARGIVEAVKAFPVTRLAAETPVAR